MGVFNKLLGNAGRVDAEKLEATYGNLLIEDEGIERGFSMLRDL